MKPYVATITLNPALDKTVILPRLEIGGLNRATSIRLDPGGKGINVARVLKNFGVDVLATGLMAGFYGRRLIKELENEGIGNSFLEVEGETRTNLKIVDEERKITTEINEPGFAVFPKDLKRFEKKLTDLLNNAAILVIGGSLPVGAPETTYREYLQIAKEMGVKTILDADGPALKEGIKAGPYALKPNIYELEKLMGRRLDNEEEIVRAGREICEEGVALVVISMGSEGSIVLDREEAYRVYPFSIQPQSTVGAGDSMVAALIYSLLENKSLEEIAKWTTTAGTVTASKAGTQVCSLAEVKQHLNQVRAERIGFRDK